MWFKNPLCLLPIGSVPSGNHSMSREGLSPMEYNGFRLACTAGLQ